MSEANQTDPKRCAATRRDGEPCRAFALAGGYCFSHDPARQAERKAARAKGGYHSSKVARLKRLIPERLLPIYTALEAALNEVHDGTLDPRQATAMAAIARAMTTVLQCGELEERLRRLEAQTEGKQWQGLRAG